MRDGWTNDEVDTSQLLETLEKASGEETLANGSLEAVHVCSLADAHLIAMVCLDLGELFDERWVVGGKAAELGERFGGLMHWSVNLYSFLYGTDVKAHLLMLVLLDQEARCLGKEDQADNDDDGPQELDGHGNTVGSSVIDKLSCVVDDRGEEETNGDCKLVGTNNCSTDPFGCRLGLVEGYQS